MDRHAYEPVACKLVKHGHNVVIYKTDKILSGEERLLIAQDDDANLEISYQGIPVGPNDIQAAWYRKISAFRAGTTTDDQAKKLHLASEIRTLHDTIWSVYPEDLWLNAPEKMRHADKKLGQLALARKIGFQIPPTAIASEWSDIQERLLKKHPKIIAKTLRGIISEGNDVKAMYTTILDAQAMRRLDEMVVTPFPGLYQPFFDKAREWRVTVVGDRIFPAAIYTDLDAKDDWRRHQLKSSVKFQHDTLPEGVEEKCIDMLGKLGLRFGAFDFIETSDNRFIFLECNPNGQYGWLEDGLGFPISDAIADELAAIAQSRQ